MVETERVPEPGDGNERDLLLGWLAFHRNALEAKCAGLSDDQLVTRSASPSPLSLLGLVRHLAEMERVYGVWANGCTSELVWVWGTTTRAGPTTTSTVTPRRSPARCGRGATRGRAPTA